MRLAADEIFWNNPVFHDRLWEATGETLLMMIFTTLAVAIIGLPLGSCCTPRARRVSRLRPPSIAC